MENFSKWAIALGGSGLTYFFGGWSGVLGVLLVFVALDYMTGFAAAAMTGTLKSNTGLFGIARKVFIFAMVSVAHLVDGVLGDGHLFRDAVAFFYIANELLSIIENGGKLGAPIPPAIRQAIEVLKGKGGAGDHPGNLPFKSNESSAQTDDDSDVQKKNDKK
ncbi:toxin secretion/phage lysis holin [Paenibacillus amylolyticus]|uniref:Toxin secretion/phage lysis holin n=1 Tax=Paenibacillus amylolyticus TaxID=1451 RepID=A0AAP5H0C4_PAEAM|nr:phage holin family protein [Paenibacillus amylolyticus]MDR6723983.1 toxin secretion/phage lysis holin [Paenibacillus amylolyticus]